MTDDRTEQKIQTPTFTRRTDHLVFCRFPWTHVGNLYWFHRPITPGAIGRCSNDANARPSWQHQLDISYLSFALDPQFQIQKKKKNLEDIRLKATSYGHNMIGIALYSLPNFKSQFLPRIDVYAPILRKSTHLEVSIHIN